MLRLAVTILLFFAALAPCRADRCFPAGSADRAGAGRRFAAAAGLCRFQDAERHVSVVIAELPPRPMNGWRETLFGKDPPGATKVTRESFPFNSGIGYLHTARVVENGATIRRWLLIATPAAPGMNSSISRS